jgi:hypothetical protein
MGFNAIVTDVEEKDLVSMLCKQQTHHRAHAPHTNHPYLSGHCQIEL